MCAILARLTGVVGLLAAAAVPAAAQQAADSTLAVDDRVALSALISLAEGHLVKMRDFLELVAAGEGRTADWGAIRPRLLEVGRYNAPAGLWFARPDGSYWSVTKGLEAGNLKDRGYFRRLLAGETVTGALVVSKATGRSVAVVAVPAHGADGRVVGAVGSSIYLDSLSIRLTAEMGLPPELIFYAIDSVPLGALHRDPSMIFTEPLTLGDDLARAIREMLAHDEGMVSYRFANTTRTVRYRRSPVTGWWYAFGVARP